MINFTNHHPKILVIGDLIIDHYLWGSSERISPEAPVPVISIDNENMLLGGAGNVVNNLKTLGAEVDVISVIGQSDYSKELLGLLEQINLSTKYLVTQKDFTTCKKSRVIVGKQQVIRYDKENSIEANTDSILSVIKNYDIILLSDYAKGLLTYELTQSIIKVARINQKKILIDPKGKDFSKYKGAYLLTPNKKEASEAPNIDINDNYSLLKAIKIIKDKCELEISIITLSEQGVASFDTDLKIYPTATREVFDVTGAGDTIIASLGFALSSNLDMKNAIEFANLASGVVIGKLGSATASLHEISQYESSLNKSSSDKHIKTWNEIAAISSELRIKEKRIVFTNGCFDILHSGHVKYLEKSKSFGDILIIGLNSDESVKRLKGKNRPVNSQIDRAYILASLEVVDYVVVFNEETPLELIKLVQPEVLVKGGDYNIQTIVGADLVNEVKLVEFHKGKSTSKIIEKISNLS